PPCTSHLPGRDRFRQIPVESGLFSPSPIFRLSVRREGDDGDIRGVDVIFQPPRHFQTIDEGDVDVEQNQIRLFLASQSDPLPPIDGDDDPESRMLEDRAIDVAIVLMVLHQQDGPCPHTFSPLNSHRSPAEVSCTTLHYRRRAKLLLPVARGRCSGLHRLTARPGYRLCSTRWNALTSGWVQWS